MADKFANQRIPNTIMLIRNIERLRESCMFKRMLIPVVIVVLLATGCNSETGANDNLTEHSPSIATSSNQSSGQGMLSAEEAKEKLRLDKWINTRIRQSDDGISTWMAESQVVDATNTPVEKKEYLIDGSVNFSYRNTFNSAGQITSTEKYDSQSKWLETVSYFYDGNGFLVEEDRLDSTANPEKTYYENGPNGDVVSEKTYVYLKNGDGMFLSREVIRDERGNLISTTEYSKPEGKEAVQSFRSMDAYDENDRLIESVTEFEQRTEHTTYQYSADGLTRTAFTDGDYASTEVFDKVGNKISSENKNGTRMEREYNSFSQITHEKYTNEAGLTSTEDYYEYDDHGLKVAEWTSSVTPAGKRLIRARTFDYVNSETGEIVETLDAASLYKRYPPLANSTDGSGSIELSSLVGGWVATDAYSGCQILIHENGDLDFSVNTPNASGVRPALLNITEGNIEEGIDFEAYSNHQCTIALESGMLHLTGHYGGLMANGNDAVDIYFKKEDGA